MADILQTMALNGYMFTTEQILILGDYPGEEKKRDRTLSLWMIHFGHHFSFEEIIRLNNPADRFGATLAHWEARFGHRFSVAELLVLGNVIIDYSENNVYYFDIMIPYCLFIGDISEDEEYNCGSELLHNGATVAHIMAREGHRFTNKEISKLGNPIDKAGLSIKDWMERVEKKL